MIFTVVWKKNQGRQILFRRMAISSSAGISRYVPRYFLGSESSPDHNRYRHYNVSMYSRPTVPVYLQYCKGQFVPVYTGTYALLPYKYSTSAVVVRYKYGTVLVYTRYRTVFATLELQYEYLYR